jgi:hypothetical protein
MKLIERDTCNNGHNLRVPGALTVNAQSSVVCRACAKEAMARFRALNRPAKRESARRTQSEILIDNARIAVLRNNKRIEAAEAKIAVLRGLIEEIEADNARIEQDFLGEK